MDEITTDTILAIYQKVMALPEDQAKIMLLGLIIMTQGGGYLSFFKKL